MSKIVNFQPNSTARVLPSLDADGHTCLAPLVEEFRLTVVDVKPNFSSVLSKLENASTLFVIKGSGSVEGETGEYFDLHPGQAYFIPKDQEIVFKASENGLIVYRTSVGNV